MIRDVEEEARLELILKHAGVNFAHDIHVRHGAYPGCVRHQIELSRALCDATLGQNIEEKVAADFGTDGRAGRSVVHLGDVHAAVAVLARQNMNGSAFTCHNNQ